MLSHYYKLFFITFFPQFVVKVRTFRVFVIVGQRTNTHTHTFTPSCWVGNAGTGTGNAGWFFRGERKFGENSQFFFSPTWFSMGFRFTDLFSLSCSVLFPITTQTGAIWPTLIEFPRQKERKTLPSVRLPGNCSRGPAGEWAPPRNGWAVCCSFRKDDDDDDEAT